jgi:hypothetical protein
MIVNKSYKLLVINNSLSNYSYLKLNMNYELSDLQK